MMSPKVTQTTPLEGDYIETIEGLLFAVKGVHHPPDFTIAYLRYIPHPEGDRTRDGKRYLRLYDLEKTDFILRDKFPQYLNFIKTKSLELQSVPDEFVVRRYDPREKLKEIMASSDSPLEDTINMFIKSLEGQGISADNLGISGSVLINLEGPRSDIDIISYGVEEGCKVYQALKRLRRDGGEVKPYNSKSVLPVLKSRWRDTGKDLEKFIQIEARKILHGFFGKREYFTRLVKLPHEYANDGISKPLKKITINGKIIDASESIFTPCSYVIDECNYEDLSEELGSLELLSYRGKFTEQATENDIVMVKGTLEEIVKPDEPLHRIVLGGKGDYLIPIDS